MTLMDERRVERSLKRIAHQVVEDVADDHTLKVVGIQERGYSMARRLTQFLAGIYETELTCSSLAVKGHQPRESAFDTTAINPDNDFVLLVDDVIFSGSTMFQALQVLTEHALPVHMHCAVLIDRGHRQLPVKAKYVGMSIPTKLNEHVSVEVSDDGDIKEVNLFF